MFIEDLEADYTWSIIKHANDYKIYKGTYLDESYYISEQFNNDESALSFYSTDLIILNEGEKISLERLNSEEPDYDFYGYRFDLNCQNKSISAYKDEWEDEWGDEWIFLINTGKSIMVFEDDDIILSEIEEELSLQGYDVESLFEEKQAEDELTSEFLQSLALVLGAYYIAKLSDE